MTNEISELTARLQSGDLVPYLGPGALDGVTDRDSGMPIPADSDSLILAMNDGTPMAPRLMYEFPRAAMNLEQKKGRSFVTRFLDRTYSERTWTEGRLHRWLAELELPYVIDINRDTQLQTLYRNRPHTLVTGLARIGGTDYRFKLFEFADGNYREITLDQVDTGLPVLFKPMGTPVPESHYIASDADYVDYITELMGGFAIPSFIKQYRRSRQYLLLGLRMTRDTERMILSDIIYDASEPAGWALIADPSEKERRFCKTRNIRIIEEDWQVLVAGLGAVTE